METVPIVNAIATTSKIPSIKNPLPIIIQEAISPIQAKEVKTIPKITRIMSPLSVLSIFGIQITQSLEN